MGSLVYSRECVEATAVFRDLLPSRPRRRKLSMWFQALEFSVSCAVTKYIFYSGRKSRGGRTRFSKMGSLTPPFETRATEFRFLSRCPRRHLVRAGLAIAAATVFLDTAAEVQRSQFYTVAAKLRTYDLPKKTGKKSTYELLLLQQ